MKNLINSFLVIICTISIFNLNAQESVSENNSEVNDHRYSINAGVGSFMFEENFLYIDGTHLMPLNQHFSFETKACVKIANSEYVGSLVGLELLSGIRMYLAKESYSMRPFVNVQVGGGVLISQDNMFDFEDSKNNGTEFTLLPDFGIGAGLEINNKLQVSMSMESLSLIAKVGYTF